MIGLLLVLMAVSPADLVPAAPQLLEAEARLSGRIAAARALERATLRLQARWTEIPAPAALPIPKGARGASPEPTGARCARDARLEVGWRAARFGAAWREAAQAAGAQAARVEGLRRAETVAPLVDAAWAARLDGLAAEAGRQRRAYLEARAWQAAFVRPALSACPPVSLGAVAGISAPTLPGIEAGALTAVLAPGEGYVCPGAIRAEGAVALIGGEGGVAEGCRSADPGCGCLLAPVWPGAVLAEPGADAGGEAGGTAGAGALAGEGGAAVGVGEVADPEVQAGPQELPEPLALPVEADPEAAGARE